MKSLNTFRVKSQGRTGCRGGGGGGGGSNLQYGGGGGFGRAQYTSISSGPLGASRPEFSDIQLSSELYLAPEMMYASLGRYSASWMRMGHLLGFRLSFIFNTFQQDFIANLVESIIFNLFDKDIRLLYT